MPLENDLPPLQTVLENDLTAQDPQVEATGGGIGSRLGQAGMDLLTGAPKALWEAVPRNFEQAGTYAGGMTPWLAGVPGAALGGSVGKALDILAAHHAEQGRNLMGGLLSGDLNRVWQSMRALERALPDIGIAGAGGAARQFIGAKITAPLIGSGIKMAKGLLGDTPPSAAGPMAQKIEETMTAGQAAESTGMLKAERAVGRMPTGFDQAVGAMQDQDKIGGEVMREFADKVAPGAAEEMGVAGKEVYTGLKTAEQKAIVPIQNLYRAVWSAVPKPQPITNFVVAQQQITGENALTGKLGTGVEKLGEGVGAKSVFNPKTGGVVNTVAAINPQTGTLGQMPAGMVSPRILGLMGLVQGKAAPLETMHYVRSQLLQIARGQHQGIGRTTPEGRHAMILAAGMAQDMEDVFNRLPGNVKGMYDQAQRRYLKEVAQIFNNPSIMKTIRRLGEDEKYATILPLIFPRGAEVGPVQQFKRAVPAQVFDRAAATWWKNIVQDSTEAGKFSLERFNEKVEPRNIKPEFLREVFGQAHAKDLEEAFGYLRQIERTRRYGASPSGMGSGLLEHALYTRAMVIGGAIAGTALHGGPLPMELAGGYFALEVALPNLLSKAMFSRSGAKAFTAALRPDSTVDTITKSLIRLKTITDLPMPGDAPEVELPEETPRIKEAAPFTSAAFPR